MCGNCEELETLSMVIIITECLIGLLQLISISGQQLEFRFVDQYVIAIIWFVWGVISYWGANCLKEIADN